MKTARRIADFLKTSLDALRETSDADLAPEADRFERLIEQAAIPPVEFASVAATGEGDPQQKAIDALRDIADQPIWDEGVSLTNLVATYDAMRETARKALAGLAETSPAAREALQNMENAG
jgi:hypothetical protein